MDIKNFLNTVCEQIKYKPVRPGISEELEQHISEIKEEYIAKGIEENEAEEKAVLQMGNAEDIGKKIKQNTQTSFRLETDYSNRCFNRFWCACCYYKRKIKFYIWYDC